MSFNLRDELNKLSNTAPILKDIDEYSDDGNSKKNFLRENLIFFKFHFLKKLAPRLPKKQRNSKTNLVLTTLM